MDATVLKNLATDPAAFRAALRIDADAGPRLFGESLDDWQRRDFEILDPACRAIVGQDVEAKYRRAWIERPRGHSKTSDIAAVALWLLFASRRKLSGVAAAADKDQAALLRSAILGYTRFNPWLSQFVNVQAYVVKNPHTASELRILSSDVATSWGVTPDFIVADELAHWKEPAPRHVGFSAVFRGEAGEMLDARDHKRRFSGLMAMAGARGGAIGSCLVLVAAGRPGGVMVLRRTTCGTRTFVTQHLVSASVAKPMVQRSGRCDS